MAFVDYYKIMGVPKDYPQEKMKDAYHVRAKQFHPDLNKKDPKAKAKFQALQEAKEVLFDPKKRKLYDTYGQRWREAEAMEQQGFSSSSGGGSYQHFSREGFGDIFEDLFGGSQQWQHFRAAEEDLDIQATADIDLYTALLGGEISLHTSSSILRVKVHAGTQNGSKLRFRGKGYQGRNGKNGDLIVTINVVLPEHLNETQKELLYKMKRAG